MRNAADVKVITVRHQQHVCFSVCLLQQQSFRRYIRQLVATCSFSLSLLPYCALLCPVP